MSTLRLAVLVSGRGTNLEALANAIDAGHCSAEIVLVASDNPDAAALAYADSRGIPRAVVPFVRGVERRAWSEALAAQVEASAPDLVILAGFMRILASEFVRRFEGRLINVHPSLLPAFPGKDGVGDALAAGVRITGCSVHLVDEGVDTGPILAQAAIPVLPGDTRERLHARIQRREHELLPRVVDDFARGRFAWARIAAPVEGDDDVLVVPRFRS
jgi:phosphoribosylglycinamide formyltransferase 1